MRHHFRMRSFRPFICGATVLVCLASGCTGGDREVSHGFETTTEDGVPLALNSGPPRWEEELFEYQLVLTLKEDEREESLINSAGGFALGDDGRFYVADGGDDRIAVFDSEGRYERSIGRAGQGPGEFRTVSIPKVRDGVVTVQDALGRRVSRFRTDGTLIDTSSLPGGGLIFTFLEYWHLPGERRLLTGLDMIFEPMPGETSAASATMLDARGDTLWTHRTPDVKVAHLIDVQIMGMSIPLPTPIPFAQYPAAAFHPDHGLVITTGLDQDLYYLDEKGSVTRRIRLVIPPEAITAEDRERYLDGIREQMDGLENEQERPLFEALLEGTHFPEVKAPWISLSIDDYGFLWLRPPAGDELSRADAQVPYRIVGPDGEYLGDTLTPKGTRGRVERGHFLLVRTKPDTGGEELVVFRIRPRVPGLHYP